MEIREVLRAVEDAKPPEPRMGGGGGKNDQCAQHDQRDMACFSLSFAQRNSRADNACDAKAIGKQWVK